MKLSFPLYQMLITRLDNRPNAGFAGGLADYITVHMTGNRGRGADAAAHAQWAFEQAPYSWHVTVDDLEAWQHLSWTERGAHAGDGYYGPGNATSLAIEICMHEGIDQEKAYRNAAELIAALRKAGHGKKGIVQHNHWTGKDCPELIRAEPGRWERFLAQVKEFEEENEDMGAIEELRARVEELERRTGGEQGVNFDLLKNVQDIQTKYAPKDHSHDGDTAVAVPYHIHPIGGPQ